MKPRELAAKLIDAFLEGRPTDQLLAEAPQEAAGIATTLARNTAELVRSHAAQYAQAPTSATWAAIPARMRPLVDRFIAARRKT